MKIVNLFNRSNVSYPVIALNDHEDIKDIKSFMLNQCTKFILEDMFCNKSKRRDFNVSEIILGSKTLGYKVEYEGHEVFSSLLDKFSEY